MNMRRLHPYEAICHVCGEELHSQRTYQQTEQQRLLCSEACVRRYQRITPVVIHIASWESLSDVDDDEPCLD